MRPISLHSPHHTPTWSGAFQSLASTIPFRLGMIGLVVIAIFLYVFQVNTVTAQGYEISELNKKIKTLQETNRQIDVRIAQEQSLGRLSERLKVFNFVPADTITYIASGASVVAKR